MITTLIIFGAVVIVALLFSRTSVGGDHTDARERQETRGSRGTDNGATGHDYSFDQETLERWQHEGRLAQMNRESRMDGGTYARGTGQMQRWEQAEQEYHDRRADNLLEQWRNGG